MRKGTLIKIITYNYGAPDGEMVGVTFDTTTWPGWSKVLWITGWCKGRVNWVSEEMMEILSEER